MMKDEEVMQQAQQKIEEGLPKAPEVLEIAQIKALIPHRYPMLMVDRLTQVVPYESAVGIKNVSVNEPFFEGHFPEKPIMPGVLIVEALAQTAGALVVHSLATKDKAQVVYFMSIENARFRKPVVPGDTLELRVQKLQSRATIWKFEGKAYVSDVLHAQAVFTAMISDA